MYWRIQQEIIFIFCPKILLQKQTLIFGKHKADTHNTQVGHCWGWPVTLNVRKVWIIILSEAARHNAVAMWSGPNPVNAIMKNYNRKKVPPSHIFSDW